MKMSTVTLENSNSGTQTSFCDELSDATHAAPNATIAQEHAVSFGPVGLPQRHGLGVQIRRLDCLKEILQSVEFNKLNHTCEIYVIRPTNES